MANNIVFKTDLLKGVKGDKGDAGTTESIPTEGVIAYLGEGVPEGYEVTEATDVFSDIYAQLEQNAQDIENRALKSVVTDAYDNAGTYAVGDYCIYDDVLYKCTTAITSPEDFNSSKWSATKVTNEIAAVRSELFNSYEASFNTNWGTFYITNVGSVKILSIRDNFTQQMNSGWNDIKNGSTTIALAERYRPKADQYITQTFAGGIWATMRINTNGTMKLYLSANVPTANTTRVNFIYA